MEPKNYPRPRLTEASRVDGVRRRKDAASARLVHVVVVDLHRSADHEFAVALVVHVITQIPNTEDVRERPETVPLVLPEASFKSRTIVVRKHTSPFELVLLEVAHVDVVFPRNIAAFALPRALEGLARVTRTCANGLKLEKKSTHNMIRVAWDAASAPSGHLKLPLPCTLLRSHSPQYVVPSFEVNCP